MTLAWDVSLDMSNIITLLTDFGWSDSYVAQIKAVILSRTAAAVQIVDISHQVPPQDIRWGARLLSEAAMLFPPGTVHVAVVDPGVGTHRRIVAAEIEDQFFVVPDNGLLSLILDCYSLKQARSAENPELRLGTVSSTFHGRDIFAPLAAYLATGGNLAEVGPPAGDLQRLDFPQLSWLEEGELVLRVAGVDHFGNILSDVSPAMLRQLGEADTFLLGVGRDWLVLNRVETYAEAPPGSLVGLVNSQGKFEIALTNGNASSQLHSGKGAILRLRRHPQLEE